MKDRDHNEATVELLRQDKDFAAEYVRQCVINGTVEDIRAMLRQMSGWPLSVPQVEGSEQYSASANGLFDRVGVRYEVATYVMGELINCCVGITANARDCEQADLEVLRAASVLKAAIKAERDDLNPRDSTAIEAAIARYVPLTRRITGEGGIDAQLGGKRSGDRKLTITLLVPEEFWADDTSRALFTLLTRDDISEDDAVKCYRVLLAASRCVATGRIKESSGW